MPFALEIANMTDAESTAKKILGDVFDTSGYVAVMAEARFKKINAYAKRYKNILEVAVGRSPRDLILTEDPTVQYVATDLPDSLAQHEALIRELMRKHGLTRPNLQFVPADALDEKEMRHAAAQLPSTPIAIISEGMLPYFSREEKAAFLHVIRGILKEADGVLITSDFIVTDWKKNMSAPLHEQVAQTTGRNMRDRNFSTEDEFRAFLDECEFDVEVFNPEVELASTKKLGLENNERAASFARMPVHVLRPR